MAESTSLTDDDLRALGIEVDESPSKPASAPPPGSDKTLTQAEIDAMIASIGK